MATFSPKGRIDVECVETEIARLKRAWSTASSAGDELEAILPLSQLEVLDPFDCVQLAHVVEICRRGRSLSEAGRMLFSASRSRRASSNDADRLRKYLARFDLSWPQINAAGSPL